MNVTRKYFKTREEFLQIREDYYKEHRLGGSDLGAASGVNKYKSARRLYEEMIGGIKKPDISDKQSIKDGILCEDIVAKKFEERTGKKVHRENCVMTSDNAPHLFASIDRKVENEEAGLECKTANAFNWDSFKDGRIPESYAKQVITYLKVTGLKRWYVYTWVMGCAEYCVMFSTEVTDVDNTPEYVDKVYFVPPWELCEVEETAANFWKCVEAKVAPACDGSEDELAVIKELFPEAEDGKVVELKSVTESDLNDLAAWKEEVKVAEKKIDALENKIKDEMGSAAEGLIGSRHVSYKNNTAKPKTDWEGLARHLNAADADIKAFTAVKIGARVLRVLKAKKAS